MKTSRHKVLILGTQRMRDMSLLPVDLDRLSVIADWEWLHLEGGVSPSARTRTPAPSGSF